MKKIVLALLVLFTISINAQEKKEEIFPQDIGKKHEIKANSLTFLIGGWFDVSYENIINNESSYGVSFAYVFDEYDVNDSVNSILNYSVTPYYRRYFSEKLARGFFVEGFGMLFSGRDDNYSNSEIKDVTGFALGISIGKKYVSKGGFTAEFLFGLGRILNANDFSGNNFSSEIAGRLGISVGYRF